MADKEVARLNPNTHFANFLVQKPDYIIEKEDRDICLQFPNSYFNRSLPWSKLEKWLKENNVQK